MDRPSVFTLCRLKSCGKYTGKICENKQTNKKNCTNCFRDSNSFMLPKSRDLCSLQLKLSDLHKWVNEWKAVKEQHRRCTMADLDEGYSQPGLLIGQKGSHERRAGVSRFRPAHLWPSTSIMNVIHFYDVCTFVHLATVKRSLYKVHLSKRRWPRTRNIAIMWLIHQVTSDQKKRGIWCSVLSVHSIQFLCSSKAAPPHGALKSTR